MKPEFTVISRCNTKEDLLLGNAAFSSEGDQLFVSGHVGRQLGIYVYDVAARRLTRKKTSSFQTLELSPDGFLTVAEDGGDVSLLWPKSLRRFLRLKVAEHSESLFNSTMTWATSFSSDASYIVTGSWDCTARYWDATTGELLADIQIDEIVGMVGVLRDVDKVFLGDSFGFYIWDVEAGDFFKRRKLRGPGGPLYQHCISPDRRKTASISDRRRLLISETSSWKGKWHSIKIRPNISNLMEFTPDGEILIIGCETPNVAFVDVMRGEVIAQYKKPRDTELCGLSLSANGERLACVWQRGMKSQIEVVDITTLRKL